MRSPDQIGISWEENQLLMQQLREKAALENRRQHNIFEVGDCVVKTDPKIKHAHVRVVISTSPSGGAVLDYQGFPYKFPCVRHATDEEIKAGRRLSKIKCWSCDKEMSHSDRAENDGFCIHCNAEIEL